MKVSVDGTPEMIGRVRVTVDGVDVTDRCISADDEAGVATIFCNDTEHLDWRRTFMCTHLMPALVIGGR
jgi:hypothetical protein